MGKSKKIYMDYASSVLPNPSSIHFLGMEARKELENSRGKVAKILKTQPKKIIFTSGGTESNNLAIQGIVASCLPNFSSCALPRLRGGTLGVKNLKNISHTLLIPHIVTTNIEHPSVLETFKMLEKRKMAEISIVPVESNGIVDPKKIKKEIKKNTVLVSVMYANNEIGTIQPIKEIAREIRHYRKERNRFLEAWERDGASTRNFLAKKYLCSKNLFLSGLPIFHTDAVQAVNYLDLNVEKLGVDLLSLSGSKIEGAGRVGVLYKRKGVPLENIFGGGDQELGLRPGTENVPLIIGLAKALEIIEKIKEKENKRLTKLRDYFIDKLINSKILTNYRIVLNGDLQNRLPNNVNISIPKMPSDLLVLELSARGIYVSEKSACQSGDKKGSYVIEALHPSLRPPRTLGRVGVGSLRFSMGRGTTKADIDYTLKALSEILQKLKKWYN